MSCHHSHSHSLHFHSHELFSFLKDLKDNEARYTIYDKEFKTKDGRITSTLHFIFVKGDVSCYTCHGINMLESVGYWISCRALDVGCWMSYVVYHRSYMVCQMWCMM